MAGNRFKAEKSALNTSSSKSAPRSSRFQHDTDGHSALIKKPPLGERRSKAAIGLAVIDEAQAAHTTVVHFLHEAMLETTGKPSFPTTLAMSASTSRRSSLRSSRGSAGQDRSRAVSCRTSTMGFGALPANLLSIIRST